MGEGERSSEGPWDTDARGLAGGVCIALTSTWDCNRTWQDKRGQQGGEAIRQDWEGMAGVAGSTAAIHVFARCTRRWRLDIKHTRPGTRQSSTL